MKSLSVRFLLVVLLGGYLGAISGCGGPFYQDTVNPRFATFGVKRVGVVVWCSGYVAEDPGWASVDSLNPTNAPLQRTDNWDRELTPRITRQVCAQLTRLGYDVVDETAGVTFSPAVHTRDALSAIAQTNPPPDAVLLVSYVVSQYRAVGWPGQNGPNDAFSASTVQQTQTQDYNGRYMSMHAVEYRNGGIGAETGGVNLRGSLMLIHLNSGKKLWETGDRSAYLAYSMPNVASGSQVDPQIMEEVCGRFGSTFAIPTSTRHGLPPR